MVDARAEERVRGTIHQSLLAAVMTKLENSGFRAFPLKIDPRHTGMPQSRQRCAGLFAMLYEMRM